MSPTYGVLTDEDIIAEVASGILIADNFSPGNVKQACYELRASNTYYDLSDSKKRYTLKTPDEYILLKPYQLAVVITLESLMVPADVIGRVLMKGKLFSVGLQPVNTYADPGFSGRLGIVIFNSSPNYIRLSQGDVIAKIEFERMHGAVKKPYSGQHGYQSGIWPIPEDMVLGADEIAADSRILTPVEELRRSFGEDFGRVIDKVFRFERLLILSTVLYIGLSTIIIIYSQSQGQRLSTLTAFLLGLLTNLVSGVLAFVATNIRRKGKRP